MLLRKLNDQNLCTRLWRSLFVLAAALILLLIQTPQVSAAPHKDAIALDALCVDGLVIDHQEQPLSGWTITAKSDATTQTQVSDSNGKVHFDLGATGTWNFSITVPAGWFAVTDTAFDLDMTYGLKSCATIRFKVEQRIDVIVIKIDDDHNPLPGWTIIATPGQDNPYNQIHKAVTDANGHATFGLPPGHWIFSEQAPADTAWWAPVIPLNGVQEFVVEAPGPYTIRFKNDIKVVKYGCIRVKKVDLPPATAKGELAEPFGLPDWPIRVIRADGSVADWGKTDAFGQIIFANLPFGPYTVEEETLPGWEPVTATMYSVELSPDAKDCQDIQFQNKQTEKGFCFEGTKVDWKDNVGLPGWKISVQAIETGDIVPDAVVTNGEGKYRIDFPFNDYRVPGSQYRVVEEERDGWTAVSQTSYVVSLPKYPGACITVPPFVNRQTNQQYPQPQSDYPKKHGGQHGNQQGQPQSSGSCSTYHTVQRGESLYSIAPKYGTNGAALLQANPWVRGQRNNWVYVGQQVCIP